MATMKIKKGDMVKVIAVSYTHLKETVKAGK